MGIALAMSIYRAFSQEAPDERPGVGEAFDTSTTGVPAHVRAEAPG